MPSKQNYACLTAKVKLSVAVMGTANTNTFIVNSEFRKKHLDIRSLLLHVTFQK